MITKSDFLKFQECPSFFWFWKNDQSVLSDEKADPFVDRLKSQGYQVEQVARHLFPNGQLVMGQPKVALQKTEEMIADGVQEIFQASFLEDGLFASCDMLIWNDMFQGWDIIEVKSTTCKDKKKKEHLIDLAFQRIVAQKAGLKIINVYLLELDKTFLKNGDIDPEQLFKQSEVTTECIDLEYQVLAEIEDAKELLEKPNPVECSCKYKGRSKHCLVFDYLYPNVPAYSIYDLRAIGRSEKTLRTLVDSNYLRIDEIPDNIKLNKTHTKQRQVHLDKKTIINKSAIQCQLDKLQYPLYFLDYETLPCAIPKYDMTYPYQQTVFQYSLHIVQKDGSIEHKEYIHRDESTPVFKIPEKLREDIGDKGSVIVWNEFFEGRCNEDMAAIHPELNAFLLDLNARIYELMVVFRNMDYLDDQFKGSYSIKNVLPVICPELTYDDMDVSNGAEAVVEYENLIFGEVHESEKELKFNALLEYCKLDTWAMVRIFQELEKIIKDKTVVLQQPKAA